MKKILLILTAVIGFAFAANAQDNCASSSRGTDKYGRDVINFTNDCSSRITCTYEYWNGSKWTENTVPVAAHDKALNRPTGTKSNLPKGYDDSVRNITYSYY
ncbi:MAG: DUF2510 domain-containing protein [Bacteroidetes bacterium]|nr:DUF2510 domain-containing protein [Bacteroidota bacterium]